MKKLVLGVIATVLFANFASAQDADIVSGKISSKSFTADIPIELKSDVVYKSESEEFVIHKHYYADLKGYITVITDSRDKVVAVTLPTTTSEARLRDVVKCFKNAFWGDGTGWSGFWDCVVN
jgi:hypothetical protein